VVSSSAVVEQEVHAVVFHDPQTDRWVGVCLEYDVVTQGATRDQAFEHVQEAVELTIAGMSPDDLDDAFQPLDGEPEIRKITIRAPTLLNA
jgi:predicted RNase H-like HicB family nuclease